MRLARHHQRTGDRLNYLPVNLQARIETGHRIAENFTHDQRITKNPAHHGQGNKRVLFHEKPPHHDAGELREFPSRLLQNLPCQCVPGVGSGQNAREESRKIRTGVGSARQLLE